MSALRAPTLAELADLLRREHDPQRRAWLEDRYWAKTMDEHGQKRAAHWRWEYGWLRGR